jgi:C4-dicarboxylate-specific signal transduction histidine kinase
LLYAAAVLTAWLAGRAPGLLAALLAALVVDYFITPPLSSITLDFDFPLRIAVFALSALLVGWLSVRRRRMEDALRLSRDELEVRVQARTADLTRTNEQLHAEIAARHAPKKHSASRPRSSI